MPMDYRLQINKYVTLSDRRQQLDKGWARWQIIMKKHSIRLRGGLGFIMSHNIIIGYFETMKQQRIFWLEYNYILCIVVWILLVSLFQTPEDQY